MKKVLLVLLSAFSLIVTSCASTSKQSDGNFSIYESEVSDSITIQHKYMKDNNISSLSSTQSAYLIITDDELELYAKYTSSEWLFTTSIYFINEKKESVRINLAKYDSNSSMFKSSEECTEYLKATVSDDKARELKEFIEKAEVLKLYFSGRSYRSNLFKINDKTRTGYLETIDYYLNMEWE